MTEPRKPTGTCPTCKRKGLTITKAGNVWNHRNPYAWTGNSIHRMNCRGGKAIVEETEWLLTRENVHRLWDQDVIRVFCKPHWAPAPAGHHVSTVIDGLTIGEHAGKPRQVARFGDRITHDADGRYTVHPATQETKR